jgi:hypothetical protein
MILNSMKIHPIVPQQLLGSIKGKTLFYPCCANDLLEPINLFAPFIQNFWFVDLGFFEKPRLRINKLQKLLEKKFHFKSRNEYLPNIAENIWRNDIKYLQFPPLIRKETYLDRKTNLEINIFYHRRTGPSALRTEIEKLGVFFYRKDSSEGGSGTMWLTLKKGKHFPKTPLILEVINKIEDEGLIITDGSMCEDWDSNIYNHFQKFKKLKHDEIPSIINDKNYFLDHLGNKFTCVGCVSDGNGPTLIWQI